MSHNDLAAIPEEYTKKKEEQLAKNTVKRMSAQQRQYNKVSRVFTMQPSHACIYMYECTPNIYMLQEHDIHVVQTCTFNNEYRPEFALFPGGQVKGHK